MIKQAIYTALPTNKKQTKNKLTQDYCCKKTIVKAKL